MWIGLREVETSYAGDSVEVLSIAQSEMKYLMTQNLQQLFYKSGYGGMIETLLTTSMVRHFFRGSSF